MHLTVLIEYSVPALYHSEYVFLMFDVVRAKFISICCLPAGNVCMSLLTEGLYVVVIYYTFIGLLYATWLNNCSVSDLLISLHGLNLVTVLLIGTNSCPKSWKSWRICSKLHVIPFMFLLMYIGECNLLYFDRLY